LRPLSNEEKVHLVPDAVDRYARFLGLSPNIVFHSH